MPSPNVWWSSAWGWHKPCGWMGFWNITRVSPTPCDLAPAQAAGSLYVMASGKGWHSRTHRTKEPVLSIYVSKARGWQKPRGYFFFLALDREKKKKFPNVEDGKAKGKRVWVLWIFWREISLPLMAELVKGNCRPLKQKSFYFLWDKPRNIYFPKPAKAKTQEGEGQIDTPFVFLCMAKELLLFSCRGTCRDKTFGLAVTSRRRRRKMKDYQK